MECTVLKQVMIHDDIQHNHLELTFWSQNSFAKNTSGSSRNHRKADDATQVREGLGFFMTLVDHSRLRQGLLRAKIYFFFTSRKKWNPCFVPYIFGLFFNMQTSSRDIFVQLFGGRNEFVWHRNNPWFLMMLLLFASAMCQGNLQNLCVSSHFL